jgi:GTP-binding protein
MIIKTAIFKVSSTDLKGCPKPTMPEYAFIGRSNVGKSSLINMLCNRKELAHTSSNPGKTISMNYFLINDAWYLVDLPGYGYARRSKSLRKQWENTLTNYLNKRENLVNLFVLIDSRIPPQAADVNFINQIGEKGIPFSIVFTKTDKLKPGELENKTQLFKDTLLEYWEELPPMFNTSSLNNKGRDDLLKFISKCNQTYHKSVVE